MALNPALMLRTKPEDGLRPTGFDQGESKRRVIDMFAGIGGFSLGLHRTGGFETVAFAEVDPYASRVLAERFPDVPNVGDVQTADYPDADFICAGFPCQDISFAGDGAGLAGARSGLWREVVRAIRVVRPAGALLENVAALLSRGMGTVLGDLAEVGHDAEWHCIPAAAVGAPHRRDRIWIATHPRGDEHESGRAPISGEIAAELSRAVADAEVMLCDGGNDNARSRGGCSEPLSQPRDGDRSSRTAGDWWGAEPDVGRVAHGVPSRVDRLRCLGNAVVPQIPEMIGRAIHAAASTSKGIR